MRLKKKKLYNNGKYTVAATANGHCYRIQREIIRRYFRLRDYYHP